MTAREIALRPQHPEPPSPALVAARTLAAHANVAANAARTESIVRARKVGQALIAIAADQQVSTVRVRQILAVADSMAKGRTDAFFYLSTRARTSLLVNGWETVQKVQDAYLARPGGELLRWQPNVGWKTLKEIRRWLWLQTEDPRFDGLEAAWTTPSGLARAR